MDALSTAGLSPDPGEKLLQKFWMSSLLQLDRKLDFSKVQLEPISLRRYLTVVIPQQLF